MNTAQATINVRMNAALKERGDGVLREHGLSTSQAIRVLWRQLAQTREVPAFLLDAEVGRAEAERRRKRAALEGLSRCVTSDEAVTDEALADLRFQSLMDKYETLS